MEMALDGAPQPHANIHAGGEAHARALVGVSVGLELHAAARLQAPQELHAEQRVPRGLVV